MPIYVNKQNKKKGKERKNHVNDVALLFMINYFKRMLEKFNLSFGTSLLRKPVSRIIKSRKYIMKKFTLPFCSSLATTTKVKTIPECNTNL